MTSGGSASDSAAIKQFSAPKKMSRSVGRRRCVGRAGELSGDDAGGVGGILWGGSTLRSASAMAAASVAVVAPVRLAASVRMSMVGSAWVVVVVVCSGMEKKSMGSPKRFGVWFIVCDDIMDL